MDQRTLDMIEIEAETWVQAFLEKFERDWLGQRMQEVENGEVLGNEPQAEEPVYSQGG